MTDDSGDILVRSFLQEALVSSSGMGRDVHSLMFIKHSFSLLTTALPNLQGALKDGLGEAVMAYDTPEPCKLLSLDSCQKVPVDQKGS